MRIPIKMTEPLVKPCSSVAYPCIGVCSTSTIASVWCCGCNRHYKDVINWNQYSEEEKILAMWRAVNHRELKKQGKVDDHQDYKYEQEGFNIK
jgi:predicted Fe-S protein YdhL (DUF1289 family)